MTSQKDNSGALFKNDRKTSDKHPDYRGPLMVNGVQGHLSAWLNKTDDGRTYMGLKFTPDSERPQAKAPAELPEDESPF